ncbi:heat shock transcription factor, X-linked member 4-like [Apis dorsata]|uniref:heat shock transcription factor, X-linked member 4-like n=1 Tax=Apis dorsata TaxID=7462 RepID=UPI0012933267|nr:heat shock transcription factor, X-linked member 4-like [Apis dorsata]
MYDDCIFLSLRFPQKLWRIVNECKSGAIRWSLNGNTILLDYKKFQEQYLDAGNSIFKTKNITSFIRQLNLYGFRKVTSHNRDPICNSHNPDVHEFLHENFRTGRPDLLPRVYRKTAGKLKHCQRLKVKNSAELNFLSKDSDHVSRLHMCRLALTKALEQISREYQQTQNHRIKDENTLNSSEKVFNLGLYTSQNHEPSTIDWITKNSIPISSKKENLNDTQLTSNVYVKWTNFSKNIN